MRVLLHITICIRAILRQKMRVSDLQGIILEDFLFSGKTKMALTP